MQLWEYWGYCGEIESLDMMTFPDTGRFRGIVFITFKTVRLGCAVACDGYNLAGCWFSQGARLRGPLSMAGI